MMHLLSESNYYKIVLKGKNILIKSASPSKHVFGALNENNNHFWLTGAQCTKIIPTFPWF